MMATFIIGYPGETEETIQENINFIEMMELDFYTLKEFYYMKHTAVHQRREEFGLEGFGGKWSHNTMNSRQASAKKIEMFKKIKKSVFVDPDTSLWYIACLYDQGFSIEIISQVQKEINTVMRDQVDGVFNDEHSAFVNLKKLLV